MLLLLSGCYREVYIPVYSCPEPVIPKREVLKVDDKTLSDTDSILKAMIYDISYLRSYSDQLISILNGYKTKGQGVPVLPDGTLQK